MKRRVVIHPPLKTFKPGTQKPPPFLHMDVYMALVRMPRYKRIYFQYFTFGEYNHVDAGKWCWRATCRCGVWYFGTTLEVRNRMARHIKDSGHEPGSVYTVSGRPEYLERKAQKKRSTR